MEPNESNLDRIIRILGGVVLLILHYSGLVTGVPGTALVVLGLYGAYTGAAGLDPLYALLKINTYKPKE